MNRSEEITAALKRWEIETAPGTDLPSMPSVKAAGDTLARLLRESQPAPALDYLGNAIGEEPIGSQPAAPAVGEDEALLAELDGLSWGLRDHHSADSYELVQRGVARLRAALADVARLTEERDRYRRFWKSAADWRASTQWKLDEARAALAAAVEKEREACAKMMDEAAVDAYKGGEIEQASGFRWAAEEIRARAGRNDG